MNKQTIPKGVRLTQQDVELVQKCQQHYGFGNFSNTVRFIIREWERLTRNNNGKGEAKETE